MAYRPLTDIPQQFFDSLGDPLAGGTLYAYLAGTSTPTNLYSDNAGTVAGTSVTLDSRGEPTTFKLIWLDTTKIYKLVLKDSLGSTIWTVDNISGDDGSGSSASSVFDQQTITATASQTLFNLGFEYVTGTNAMAVYKNGARLITGTDFTETSSTSVTLTQAAQAGDEYTFVGGQDVSSSFSSSNVSFTQSGTGAVIRSVQTKLREFVSVKDFGAVGDGVTDDSGAIQAAVDYCATFSRWPSLLITGRCRVASSVTINRLVDSTVSEFRIIGNGPGAGFYVDSDVTLFDSDLTYTTAPQSEFITFENLFFEADSVFRNAYVLSENFLRIKFINCHFMILRCQLSTLYAQTLYFSNCNIRNNPASFINCLGLYDVTFNHCIIENGSTVVRCVDAVRGCAGLRFIDCVIEGIYASIVVATGVAGFDLIGNHIEANYSPEFNFFAGGMQNQTVNVVGNYIYNPGGATFYYGPCTKVFSAGNFASPSVLHSNADQVTDLVSTGDNCVGGISDATKKTTINGVYRSGAANAVWTDTDNHITKSAAGEFAFGRSPVSGCRIYAQGSNQLLTDFMGVFADSLGNPLLALRNDRKALLYNLQNYADDAAAAGGGIPVNGLYRNGSVVMVRVV